MRTLKAILPYLAATMVFWWFVNYSWFSFFAAVAGIVYLSFSFFFPFLMGKHSGEQVEERVRTVFGSSTEIASARTGGEVANVRLSFPFMKVCVFQGGIIVRLLFMGTSAILNSEIKSIESVEGLLSRYIQINHSSWDIGSPVRIYVSADSDVSKAVESITGMRFSSTRVFL